VYTFFKAPTPTLTLTAYIQSQTPDPTFFKLDLTRYLPLPLAVRCPEFVLLCSALLSTFYSLSLPLHTLLSLLLCVEYLVWTIGICPIDIQASYKDVPYLNKDGDEDE